MLLFQQRQQQQAAATANNNHQHHYTECLGKPGAQLGVCLANLLGQMPSIANNAVFFYLFLFL
jgi:hypothetical protein